MTQTNYTTENRHFKHLSDIQRGKLEQMAKCGTYTQTEMACELGVSQSTVSRELRRGRTRQLDYQHNYYEQYIAVSGARVYQENRANSHARNHHKYSAAFFATLSENLVPKNGLRLHSVDTFVRTYRKSHPEERVPCTKTVYALINAAVLSIRNIDLPMKTRMRPRKKIISEPKGRNAKHLGRSIEERTQEVLSRETFGHWEVDLVLGKKTKNEPVIITMVERKTRYFLTKKVWGKSATLVQKGVLDLMKKQGLEQFKTITTDNGSEFSTLSLIEENFSDIQVFFTHAYASWEKGTNERHNRMLREFIPKGITLRPLSYSRLHAITDVINNRPRKIMNYATPVERLQEELAKLKAA